MFRVMSDGTVNFCCANPTPLGNILRDGIDEIWNGERARTIRRQVARGEYGRAGCAGCFFWGGNKDQISHWPAPEIPLTPSQSAAREVQRREYDSGLERLQSGPSVVFAQPSYACNIDCVMCNQRHAREAGDAYVDSPDALVASVIDLPVVPEMVILQGGEPLLSRTVLHALEVLAGRDANTQVSLNTNGLLLDRALGLLEGLRFLRLNVSVDAGDRETYEDIRRGGSWDRLTANLRRVIARRRPGWTVNLHHLLMRRNLARVDAWLETHEGLVDQQRVFPIAGVENRSENVFCYHFLLDDCPGWEGALERALLRASERGDAELDAGLRYCRDLLDGPCPVTATLHRDLSERLTEPDRDALYAELVRYRSDVVSGRTAALPATERFPVLAGMRGVS
jgi:uncharacterized Fe-S cluster-containing radical SAM superfamily protein